MAETKKEIIVENNELMDKELQDVSGGAKNTDLRNCKKCGAFIRRSDEESWSTRICKKCRVEMAMAQHANGE